MIALIGIIAALAVPAFIQQLERMKVRRAIADLATIEFEIERYEAENDVLPDSAEDLERPIPVDPWGRTYVYFRFGEPGGRGKARKDRFLVPINSSFGLYSVGRDGQSEAATAGSRELR